MLLNKPGFAGHRIGIHRHMGDRHLFLAGLDQHLDGVAEGGNDVQVDGRLSGDGPKAAHRIRAP